MQNFVNKSFDQRPIEKLPHLFAAVAAKLQTSEGIACRNGNAGLAVRASAAVPGVFRPVTFGPRGAPGWSRSSTRPGCWILPSRPCRRSTSPRPPDRYGEPADHRAILVNTDLVMVYQNFRLKNGVTVPAGAATKAYAKAWSMPNLTEALEWCTENGLSFDDMHSSCFLSRETLIPRFSSAVSFWRDKLFIAMFR